MMSYELSIWTAANGWEKIAIFDPTVVQEMIGTGRAIAVNPLIGAENVAIIDHMTGEVVWDSCSETEEDSEDDCDYEDPNFDVYAGGNIFDDGSCDWW